MANNEEKQHSNTSVYDEWSSADIAKAQRAILNETAEPPTNETTRNWLIENNIPKKTKE